MPTTGEIISWPNYPFPDGSHSNKLFVVLNNSSNSEDPCLLLITTAQSKWYPNFQNGCNLKLQCFHIPLEWREGLRKPTFVLLPNILEITCAQLWGMYEDGVVALNIRLSAGCFKKMKECLLLFRGDISPRHYTLIFS